MYIQYDLFWPNNLTRQGVRLAVAHSPVAIGRHFNGRPSENKIDNIMFWRELIIFCVIEHHSGSLITLGNLIW